MPDVEYGLASLPWGSAGVIEVDDFENQRIASVPLAFLRQGKVETWDYVYEVISHCIEEQGFLLDADNNPVKQDSPVVPGRYALVRQDNPTMAVTFRRGPESKTKGKAPRATASESTYSNSRRSGGEQSKLRDFLIYRDGNCLLTDVIFTKCTAAHIVPFSRTDLYSSILGYSVGFFEVQMGLLLRDDVHRSFDRGEWALYCKDDTYVVHYFVPRDRDDRNLHGKVLTPERFRDPSMRPDVKLLQWHYRQCVLLRFRGFACKMNAADALKEVAEENRRS